MEIKEDVFWEVKPMWGCFAKDCVLRAQSKTSQRTLITHSKKESRGHQTWVFPWSFTINLFRFHRSKNKAIMHIARQSVIKVACILCIVHLVYSSKTNNRQSSMSIFEAEMLYRGKAKHSPLSLPVAGNTCPFYCPLCLEMRHWLISNEQLNNVMNVVMNI